MGEETKRNKKQPTDFFSTIWTTLGLNDPNYTNNVPILYCKFCWRAIKKLNLFLYIISMICCMLMLAGRRIDMRWIYSMAPPHLLHKLVFTLIEFRNFFFFFLMWCSFVFNVFIFLWCHAAVYFFDIWWYLNNKMRNLLYSRKCGIFLLVGFIVCIQ